MTVKLHGRFKWEKDSGYWCDGLFGKFNWSLFKKVKLDVTYGSRFKVGKFNEENKTILTDWNVDEINFTKGYDVIINAAGPSARACMADPNHARSISE